jgi:hypothetical protein
MTYVIRYIETPDEIAANVAAVAQSAGREYLDLMETTPEEFVAGWNDLYVCDEHEKEVEIEWSLGGVEPYEAHQFSTREDADAWLAEHGDTEPGTWEIMEL